MYNLNGENVNDNSSQTYSAPTPDELGYQPDTSAAEDPGQQNGQQTYQQNTYGQQNTYDQQNAYGQQNAYDQQNAYGQQTYQQNTYNQGAYGQDNSYGQQTYTGQTYASPTGNGGSTYNAAPGNYNPYTSNNNNQDKNATPVFAILGIIFAVVSVISGWFIPGLGVLFAIAAIVMSIIAVTKKSSLKGLGIADLILSVAALLFLIVLIIVRAVSLVNDIADDTLSYHDSMDNDFSFDFGDDDDSSYDDDDSDSFYGWEDWTDDIDDTVLYSENGVTITATDIEYSCCGDTVYPYINVLIANDTDSDIDISLEYCSINNIAMSSYMYESVNAHKKAEAEIGVDSTLFSAFRFTEVECLQFTLDVYDSDSGEYLVDGDTQPLQTFTFSDSYTPVDANSFDNAELVASAGDIDFYYLGLTKSLYGDTPSFLFYAENHSGHLSWVETDDFSIDDYMQSEYDIDTVADGNGAFLLLPLPETTDVDTVEQAAVTFEVTYYDTWDVFYSDEVVFYQN